MVVVGATSLSSMPMPLPVCHLAAAALHHWRDARARHHGHSTQPALFDEQKHRPRPPESIDSGLDDHAFRSGQPSHSLCITYACVIRVGTLKMAWREPQGTMGLELAWFWNRNWLVRRRLWNKYVLRYRA